MTANHLAFMTGLLGSIHCVGMCGPLAFAVPVLQPGWIYLLRDKLIYQAGRIISYCLLGVFAGLAGQQLLLAGLQQGLSLVSGILIVTVAISRLGRFRLPHMRSNLLRPFHHLFSYALKHKVNHLFIGMVNGLLPCGFVYLAIAGALNTGDIRTATAYMFWFGLGTVPLMLTAALSAGFTTVIFRKSINQIVPYFMLFLGIWFILRGSALNIPYLSPKSNEVAECR